MNPTFLPKKIAFVSVEPWMWEKSVYPDEEKLLASTATEKRKREFRAGRHCSHAALQQLGHSNFSVLKGKRGEPLWPAEVCGSISHASERCIAIAAHKADYLSLGIDIERDRVIKDDTLERISFEQERLQLVSAPKQFSGVNVRAILFSVKECVHKVYYPLNHHTLDFKDVAATFDWSTKSFQIHIVHPAEHPIYPIENLSGIFDYTEDYVYSRICLQKDFSCA